MFFDQTHEAPADPIFGLLGAISADPRQEKVSLMVGIYKDDHLKAELLSSVKKAKEKIASQDLMADYLPIDGLPGLIALLGPIVFGESIWKDVQERVYGAHTTGGTGALRATAEFLAQEVSQGIYIPNHTWPPHRMIFERAGFKVGNYPYYCREKKGFDIEALLFFLAKLPAKSIVLFHACCHNPTGSDPTAEEWRSISQLMREKRLFPFFDFAYQGLGEGVEKDNAAIQIFLKEGHEMAVAYSCSKNFSMYCHRVGALFVVSEHAAVKTRIESQVKRIIRTLYSNPPAHGARIVAEVLKNEKALWHKDLEGMRQRMHRMREMLIQRLNAKAKTRNFDYLRKHKGMFSFIDLDKNQVQTMIDKFAIYLTDNGRISIAGLTLENIDYVVNGILSVCGEL
jgi:aspartate/tyrosine/aromatic aminotransferase